MSYLTIIGAVWAVCALFAVLFIRGATMRDPKPVPIPVQSGERMLGKSASDLRRPY